MRSPLYGEQRHTPGHEGDGKTHGPPPGRAAEGASVRNDSRNLPRP